MLVNRGDVCFCHWLLSFFCFDKQLVTVWSAPNYCYRCGNVASILQLDENLDAKIELFDAVPDAERVIPMPRPWEDFSWPRAQI